MLPFLSATQRGSENSKTVFMQKNFILTFTFLFSFTAFSQTSLINSKWKPQTDAPRILLDFKKDTLSILFTSGREPEVMAYSQHHDSL